MDLIGGIKHIGNGPGGGKPNQGKGKHAQHDTRKNAVDENKALTDAHRPPTGHDPLLGRTINTTA